MARETPTDFPERIYVGDTLDFKKHYADFLPGDGWTLGYSLVNSSNAITLTSTQDTDDTDHHLVHVEAIVTVEWNAGTYQWQAYVDSNDSPSERFTVDRGTVELVDDFEAGAVDDRSHVKTTLDLIETEIEARVSGSIESYSIRDRSLSRLTLPELVNLRAKYRKWYVQEQAQERIELGKRPRNKVLIRFVDN